MKRRRREQGSQVINWILLTLNEHNILLVLVLKTFHAFFQLNLRLGFEIHFILDQTLET